MFASSLVALTTVLIGGCLSLSSDDEPPELPVVYLVENPPIQIVASPGKLFIWMGYFVNDDGCRRVSDSFTATINGMPLRMTRGSVDDIGIDSPDWFCTPPSGQFWITWDTAELVLADETATIRIDLGNALARRSVTFVEAEWTPGETYDLAWSPESDLALQRPSQATIYTSSGYGSGVSATVTHDDLLHVTVPSDVGYAGLAEITLSWGETRTPCANCRLSINGSLTRAIAVR